MKYQAEIDLSNKNSSHTLVFEQICKHTAGKRLKVLEVGCSSGYFGAILVQCGHEVWGVEPSAEAAAAAKKVLHRIHVGFVEDFFPLYHDERFDVVVFGDVLEHLTDPLDMLRKSAEFLAKDGIIVASVPNVAHISIRAMLLEGRWDYSSLGILDRTHLQFFTRSSLLDLFSSAGYKVLSLDQTRLSAEQVDELCDLKLRRNSIKIAKDYSQHSFDNRGYDFQYVVSAKPGFSTWQARSENASWENDTGTRVLCLVDDPVSPLVEIRLRNPLQRWACLYGGCVRVAPIYASDGKDLSWADVVILQREASEYTIELAKLLQASGKKVVFEIDDLLFDLPDFLIHHADALSVSTSELAERFAGKNKNIFVTPNYSEPMNISAAHWQANPRDVRLLVASSARIIVDMLIEPLIILQRELGVQVIGIGPPGKQLADAGIDIQQHQNFGHSEFKAFVASINNGIGLIPLVASDFSHCKTAVKYFDYSICGIPSICSNIKPYAPIIEHGINGLLVGNTTEAWVSAIRQLIESPDWRSRLVKSAQDLVSSRHNLDIAAQSWQRLFASLNVELARERGRRIKDPMIRHSLTRIVMFALRHLPRPNSYVKAAQTLRRYGVGGLYRRVVRQ